MKTNLTKKIASAVLALAVAFTAVFASATTVQASSVKVLYASENVETVSAGVEQKFPFTVSQTGPVVFELTTAAPTNVKLALYNSAGVLVKDSSDVGNPLVVYSNDAYWYADDYGYAVYDDPWTTLSAGDYYYGITFTTDTQFYLGIYAGASEAKLSQTSATITKGFTKKLSVSGGSVKSWSSKNKSIATVSKDGKITAKKTGKTTVYATLTDGTKLACKVTVKANEYKDTKGSVSDVSYGSTVGQVYSAKYDSKGNLVVKINVINNSFHRIDKIRNLKVTAKDPNGKKFVSYTLKSKNVSISTSSCKTITVTIKKSSQKKKKVDLRNSSFDCQGTSIYYY